MVRQTQLFEHFLRVRDHNFQHLVGIFRLGNHDQLHLVKLVVADQPARVLAVGAGLFAEARRISGQFNGQFGLGNDAAAV